MRPSQKLTLIDAVARELQSRYTFNDIDIYLAEFNIPTPLGYSDFTSKATYTKQTLRGVSSATLAKIVDDLEISTQAARSLRPPRNWPDDSQFRLFVSHISNDKDKATRLRECLVPYHISGFVAHQDIHPTAEWQLEIERALLTMDAFLAIHTPGFSKSFWTQQEIGFAVARGVKIISFKMGEDPTGFISKQQALPRLNRSAEAVAKEVNALLLADELTAARLKEVIAASEIPF
jgi:TIR domain